MNKQQWIKSQIALGVADLSTLNTPVLIANPISQTTISKPITIEEAVALVPPEEQFSISETKTYDRLLDAFSKGRLDWIQGNIQTLVAGNKMSISTAQALQMLINEKVPDPNWQAKVYLSPAQQMGFDAVTLQDWKEALND